MKLITLMQRIQEGSFKINFSDIQNDKELWDDINFVMEFSGLEYPFFLKFNEYDQEWFDINEEGFVAFLQQLKEVLHKFVFLKIYSYKKLQAFTKFINENVGEMKYCIQTSGDKIGEKIFYFKDADTDKVLASFILVENTALNQQMTKCIYLDKTVNTENKSIFLIK